MIQKICVLMMASLMVSSAFAMNLPDCEQARSSEENKATALLVIKNEIQKLGADSEVLANTAKELVRKYQAGEMTEGQTLDASNGLKGAMALLQSKAEAIKTVSACILH